MAALRRVEIGITLEERYPKSRHPRQNILLRKKMYRRQLGTSEILKINELRDENPSDNGDVPNARCAVLTAGNVT